MAALYNVLRITRLYLRQKRAFSLTNTYLTSTDDGQRTCTPAGVNNIAKVRFQKTAKSRIVHLLLLLLLLIIIIIIFLLVNFLRSDKPIVVVATSIYVAQANYPTGTSVSLPTNTPQF